ncbi:MAG TPA: regulatory iron-sulfur-containing complex subunit RicT [Lentisphaeria bacterium]|nr:regulatory iron-sulfur-containing complex subunit RicT [Lentisphaeria bacterium]
MKQLYKVKITSGLSYECVGEADLQLQEEEAVVVRCERYLDCGVIMEAIGEPVDSDEALEKVRSQNNRGRRIEGQRLPQVVRRAADDDVRQVKDNETQASDAHVTAMARIRAHNLEMKLIHTHYALDRKLLVFQFSAEGRVDFRELLRDLSALFRVRVELLQIGVRDEAAVLGGIGSCGRPYCCACFLTGFNSINVKMAKQQGLSLNPQNISGACGRLKCCLQFEAEVYRAAAQEQRQQKLAEENGKEEDTSVADFDEEGVDNGVARNAGSGGSRPEGNAGGGRQANSNRGQQRAEGQGRRPDRGRRGNPQGRGQQQNNSGRQGQGSGQHRQGSNSNQNRQPGQNQGSRPPRPAPPSSGQE